MDFNFYTHSYNYGRPESDIGDNNTFNKLLEQYGEVSNQKEVKDLLKRITNAPKRLEDIVNSSIPYLLPPNNKTNKKNKKKIHNKASGGNFKKTNENLLTSGEQKKKNNLKNKTLIKNKKPNDTKNVIVKENKSNKNTIIKNTNLKKNTTKPKLQLDKATQNKILSNDLIDVLLLNNEKKENIPLRNSSLFTMNEKNHLRVYNFDAVEVDIILLKKLIKLDKTLGKQLIEKIMDIETFDELQQEKNKSLMTMKQMAKDDKNPKGFVNGIMSYQLYDILLTRIIPNPDRPPQILLSALSKLNTKNVNTMNTKNIKKKLNEKVV